MTPDNYTIDRSNNKHFVAGAFGTTLLHGIIIAVLLFIVLYPPNPPLESQGMQMSLGEENMGGPNPTIVEQPAPNETYTPISENVDEPAPLTQDADESVAIQTTPEKKDNKKKEVVPVTPKQETPQLELPKKVDARALFQKASNASPGSGGYGDGPIPGNEGSPDGDPNGDKDGHGGGNSGDGNGKNGPKSDGVSFDLSGRNIKNLPNIEDNSKSVGKVVVRIVVDRDGNVIKAVPGQVGSTTTEMNLLEKAKQGALQTSFSKRADGPDEQYGYMTFIFRFKP